MEKNRGQSIVELIFAIVLVGLVLTGVVSLIVKSSGGQTESGLRDKAVNLSKLVMEGIVAESRSSPAVFWGRGGTGQDSQSNTNYPGYLYSVDYSVVTEGENCEGETVRCMEVTVTVYWQGGEEDVTFSRFFSR